MELLIIYVAVWLVANKAINTHYKKHYSKFIKR